VKPTAICNFGVREHAHGAISTALALPRQWLDPPMAGNLPLGLRRVTFGGRMRLLGPSPNSGVIYQCSPRFDRPFAEDGPTHQPVETLASLRSIPNLLVIPPRPTAMN